jgi:MYXO-CTERM domain-containing protein
MACTGCQACTTALKQNGGPDGVCGPAKDGTDPRDECAPSSPPCGPDGQCNGAGGCRVFTPDGVSCGDCLVCNGAGICGGVRAATCDGDHRICKPDRSSVDCFPFRCEKNGTCREPCTSVNDCVAPAVCDASGKCVEPPEQAGDGGCGVGPGARGHSSWTLLALLALARWRRRRVRA